MLDVITKHEYWEWQDRGLADPNHHNLKGIQDAYILSKIGDIEGSRILEIGGGNSRILKLLSEPERQNECWNADRFEGVGNGPKVNVNADLIRHANCFLGEFSPELPDSYFDVLVSVSVVEHVPTTQLEDFFSDSARVLRHGGMIYHAIDMYLYDSDSSVGRTDITRDRIAAYRSFGDRRDLRLRFLAEPTLEIDASFRCAYASNSDHAMHQWNRSAPALRPLREIAQSVSLKAEWCKY